MSFVNFFKHLHTINRHKLLVMKYCFKAGYYKRGLMHDLSKYSPTEFFNSVKYYQGTRSPTTKEREVKGYSLIWIHHKGRNPHHYEYWTDYIPSQDKYLPIEMPIEYLIESFCDRISASKVYMGKNYNDGSPLEYFLKKDLQADMHINTKKKLFILLKYLKDNGEKKTFKWIKANKHNKDFLKEECDKLSLEELKI